MLINPNSANQTVYLAIKDIGGNDATGLTLTDLTVLWVRDKSTSSSSVANVLSAVDADHNDYGMYEVSAGLFRLDLPDTCFVVGVPQVNIKVSGVAIQTVVYEVPVNNNVPSSTVNDYKADVSNLDIAVSTISGEVITALNAETYDGKTFTELMTAVRHLGFGNFSVAGVGSGTLTITTYEADGATVLATFSINETTGARTAI